MSAALEHRSWLIQRLHKPHGGGLLGKDNPFSFGGGLRNGGLSDDAMDLLRDVFAFDYMGAAEFEFGAVPKTLQKIAKADLRPSTFTIPLSKVAANWRDKSKTRPEGEATVYVLAPTGWEAEIERRVRAWAAESRDREFHTKEGTRLAAALRPVEDWDSDVCGWLELDNGYLFFTDKAMWAKACALFGIVTLALGELEQPLGEARS